MWVSWCWITVHDSALAGSVPSSASVAVPLSVTCWPTANSAPAAGRVIVGVGRRVADVDRLRSPGRRRAPWSSRTQSVAVNVPAVGVGVGGA